MEINDIVDAIAIKLDQVFNEKYPIYTEEVEQDFKEPCFFIGFLNADETQVVGRRYYNGQLFDVHYFPEKGNAEMLGMMNMLKDALETVTTIQGDLLRGTGINLEIFDGVLHAFVNYNFYVYKVKTPEESMSDVSLATQVKRGG